MKNNTLNKQNRATQTAVLISAASIPNTFQETLMPRNTTDQGLVTGITMAVNYELANIIAKTIEDIADQLSGTHKKPNNDYQAHKRQRRFSVGLNLLAIIAAEVVQNRQKQNPNESTTRGVVRTSANWVSKVALASVIVSCLQSVFEFTDMKSKKNRLITKVPVGLIGGMLTAVYTDHKRRSNINNGGGKALHENNINTIKAMGMGLGVLSTLGAVSYGQKSVASLIAKQMNKIFPDSEDFWWTGGHLAAIGATGLGLAVLMQKTYHHIEEVATKIEPSYLKSPKSSLVSGSDASLVNWESLSVQGRRHVSSVLSKSEINRVLKIKDAIDPIRVYVGLDSALTEDDRVDFALKELKRTKAFDRKMIMVISPTGTGYVNYVATESAEYMSKGNIATVALQYSKRPSPMSLDRVPEGRDQFKRLLKAISKHIKAMPSNKRPKLTIFGESLGAWTSQDCFIDQGTDGLENEGIDYALWIGTPYGSKWKTQVLHQKNRPDVEPGLTNAFNSIEDLKKLHKTSAQKLKYVMITHHNDGVALFGASLIYQKPSWLNDPSQRPPSVSKHQYYTSPGTFLQTLIDMKNSMNVIPGKFEASGHDYRADLAQFISFTYRFDVSDAILESIEKALRQNEINRAKLQS